MFATGLVFWHWLVLAMLLLLLELFAPAAFFIWIGAAAAVLGIVLMVVPALSWQIQCILFAVLAIASVVVGRKLFKRDRSQPQSTLNRRGEQYVGRQFVLVDEISAGRGKIKVDDTIWQVAGPDLPAGSKVRVESLNGATLVVVAV